MKRVAGVMLSVAVTCGAFAGPPTMDEIRTLAGSCTTTRVAGCDTETFGNLESGDCLFSDGSRYDSFAFSGTAGQLLEVTVRPLATTYSRPWIALLPPAGDPSEPPVISGGTGAAQISYKLSSSGTWRVVVSSEDVFAGGRYVIHVYCYRPEDDVPQACVPQQLLCGQSGGWRLTADSCKFRNDPSVYAIWSIYGRAGDLLTFSQRSFAFTPLFGIYRDGKLLRSSDRESSFLATMRYAVPETGWYYFITTTVEDAKGGEFEVELSCGTSGCTFPYLVGGVPPSTVVPRGSSATIPFTVNAVGGFTTKLFDADLNIAATAPSGSTSIKTPPVTFPNRYYLEFENACGTWTSEQFSVVPEPARRRAVRH
jgi:hypothetical protein